MPTNIKIDSGKNLIYFRIIGQLTVNEYENSIRDLEVNPDFRPEQNVLFDLRQGDLSSISTEEIRQLIEISRIHLRKSSQKMKTACVATKDVNFGIMRIYEFLRTDIPTQFALFREINEALDWLNSNTKNYV